MTEFALPNVDGKLYLSPVLEGYNSKIIAFTLSRSPNLNQVRTMLDKAFLEESYKDSDQEWQYQHDVYHRFWEEIGFILQCLVREIAQIMA